MKIKPSNQLSTYKHQQDRVHKNVDINHKLLVLLTPKLKVFGLWILSHCLEFFVGKLLAKKGSAKKKGEKQEIHIHERVH